jgi:hypothetical protein
VPAGIFFFLIPVGAPSPILAPPRRALRQQVGLAVGLRKAARQLGYVHMLKWTL